ncbi:hypothetical protein ACFX15_003485 [Malus domestica]
MIKSVMARDGASSSRRSNFTAPPAAMKLSERLEYRLPCTREVLRALQDENINLISIDCGKINRGDTVTTKEFMKRVKQQGLFEEVVMTVASLDPNLRRIQDEIADNLELNLGNGSLFERAEVLRARMTKDSRRLLVVLLDVRKMLDLEAIGIPYGSTNGKCKIIFMLGLLDAFRVSMRAQSSFHLTGTKKSFPIGVLPEQEAWSLFREMAGSSIESPELRVVAQQVLTECAGSPLVISAVGGALQNQSKQMWDDALRQLRNPCPRDIPKTIQEVYRKIDLCYECLGSEEAKSLFLFCCIYPKSCNILVHDLVKFGVGLELFKGIDSKREAGKCVETLIDILKSSFLLLDSDKEGCVKMHHIVRNLGLSIAASKGWY